MVNGQNNLETTLDLRGLKCPLQVLKARRALNDLPGGAVLWVEATDPMAAIDIPHMVREAGHLLLDQQSEDGILSFRIEKR